MDRLKIDADLYRRTQVGVKDSVQCKICANNAVPFDVVDFSKFCNAEPYAHGFSGIHAFYYRCHHCDCVFTDFFDDWTIEEFSRYIYNEEYVFVDPDYLESRPAATMREWIVRFDMTKKARILDFGAGSGGLARLMNSEGYDFESYDPFSSPERPSGTFDLVSAFEVVEHSPSPLETFAQILSHMGDVKRLLVGQSVQPDNIMEVRGNWWYIAPRNGHCTTFSERTFRHVAAEFGLTYVPAFGIHGFFSNLDDDLTREIYPRLADW